MIRRLLSLTPVLVLAAAAPAQAAHSFVLTRSGSKPALAVDRGGTGHFVWDQRAPDSASITHYCRVLRTGRGCAPGTERTFRPTQATDQTNNVDFPGPRVFIAPDGRVIVLTYRCCAIDGPNFHSSALFRYVSARRSPRSETARRSTSASPTATRARPRAGPSARPVMGTTSRSRAGRRARSCSSAAAGATRCAASTRPRRGSGARSR